MDEAEIVMQALSWNILGVGFEDVRELRQEVQLKFILTL